MDMRRRFAALALALALSTTGATTALAQHEGHNHGEPEGPPMGLEDISARASTVGEYFQFVALPKAGRMVIFLADAVSNAPAPERERAVCRAGTWLYLCDKVGAF